MSRFHKPSVAAAGRAPLSLSAAHPLLSLLFGVLLGVTVGAHAATADTSGPAAERHGRTRAHAVRIDPVSSTGSVPRGSSRRAARRTTSTIAAVIADGRSESARRGSAHRAEEARVTR